MRGADVLNVSLSKIGVVYGTLLAAYESMGRLVPIPGAVVVVGGKPVGSTDESGTLRLSTPPGTVTVEVTKDGFLPEPSVATVSGRSRDVVVPLYPRDAPAYRIAVLPPRNGKPGDDDVESALPEVEDRLSDYLFSYACFRRVDSRAFSEAMASANLSEEKILNEGWEKTPLSKLADAVVFSEVTNDSRLIVSIQVLSAGGERLGAFAEMDKRAKVRSICENAAKKIVEVFPFEGHVVALDGRNVVSSLGSGQDRGLQKGNEVTFFRLSSTKPTQLKPLGKGSVKSVTENSSIVVPTGDLADLTLGDKLVVLPRNREAAFNGSLALTVMAGREGFEQAFPDVNVYRDGTWVGVTSETGELRVPVASGGKHDFLFVRSGIAPHREDVKVEGAKSQRVVIMPNSISRLRVESQPSGAQVTLDGRLMGMTPLDVDVPMGFRHIKLDAGDEWRVFDKVLELTKVEEDYTGARRFLLERDVLGASDALLAKGDVDGAIAILS
ncbi:MAG TPA: PEGA domain-containing protein, partial [Vicinamibacteria bacterium]